MVQSNVKIYRDWSILTERLKAILNTITKSMSGQNMFPNANHPNLPECYNIIVQQDGAPPHNVHDGREFLSLRGGFVEKDQ